MRIGQPEVARVSAGAINAPSEATARAVADSPVSPVSPFAASRFEPAAMSSINAPTGAGAYYPTAASVLRPTPAVVVNVTNGQTQPLNPGQMSNQQGIDFVQQRLASLGYGGAGALNNSAPSVGPFQVNYNGDDRRNWDVDGMNVGLTLQLYANNPPEVADRMLSAMLATHGSTPSFDSAPGNDVPSVAAPSFPAVRAQPGTDLNAAFRAVAPLASNAEGTGWPSSDDLLRPTNARVVGPDGSSQPLNPGQMSTASQAQQVLQHLQQLGYHGPTEITNVAPSGMFNVDYGSDPRRNFNIGDLNVGLILQRYANNPPAVADQQMLAELRQQRLA